MLRQVVLELDVELDEAEHGDGDGNRLEDLHPYVCKSWGQTVLAVDVPYLRDDGDDGEENANEAVLKDADPDDLSHKLVLSVQKANPCPTHTLNHVNPLLGFRNGPLFSPPKHFCNPQNFQNQFFGFMVRK